MIEWGKASPWLAPKEKPRAIQLLRGRVAIRLTREASPVGLWMPEPGAREEKIHRGRVLAAGAPALTPGGAEVPMDFAVGDEVLFVWVHRERDWTLPWTDGLPACFVPQECVQAVIHCGLRAPCGGGCSLPPAHAGEHICTPDEVTGQETCPA